MLPSSFGNAVEGRRKTSPMYTFGKNPVSNESPPTPGPGSYHLKTSFVSPPKNQPLFAKRFRSGATRIVKKKKSTPKSKINVVNVTPDMLNLAKH